MKRIAIAVMIFVLTATVLSIPLGPDKDTNAVYGKQKMTQSLSCSKLKPVRKNGKWKTIITTTYKWTWNSNMVEGITTSVPYTDVAIVTLGNRFVVKSAKVTIYYDKTGLNKWPSKFKKKKKYTLKNSIFDKRNKNFVILKLNQRNVNAPVKGTLTIKWEAKGRTIKKATVRYSYAHMKAKVNFETFIDTLNPYLPPFNDKTKIITWENSKQAKK